MLEMHLVMPDTIAYVEFLATIEKSSYETPTNSYYKKASYGLRDLSGHIPGNRTISVYQRHLLAQLTIVLYSSLSLCLLLALQLLSLKHL